MNWLALDTATEACSVALEVDGEVHARWVEAPREHGDRLLGMIDEVLADAGIARAALDVLVFGRGPGAFTGVRIATAAVQGIAYGLDRPVVPVSTLAALAQGAWRHHGAERVLAAIDARMGEVYWGAFALGGDRVMAPVQEEQIARPEAVAWPDGGGWHGAGTGWETHGAVLAGAAGARLAVNHGRALPDARDMLPLAHAAWQRGEAVSAAEAVPVYLRDRVAERPRQR